MGNWLNEERDIVDFIKTGYSELFMSIHSSSLLSLWDPPCWNSCLKEDEAAKLVVLISDEEIASALWSLKVFKAPGPDGLYAGFFQCFWLLVRESVRKEVKQIFTSQTMPEYLNRTLITPIPKCNTPESLSNYRPISLCNIVYKIVTKVIVARIHPMLSNLVSPYQMAFVPYWKGVDNAIIIQELVHIMSKKKGRGGFMAIKIDLEKAYDRLEWSFI